MGRLPFSEWLRSNVEAAVEHKHPERPVFVVDWDGVCVHETDPHTGRIFWPSMGPWQDDAIEGLRWLSERGLTVIYSLRVSPFAADCVSERPYSEVVMAIYSIRTMLDEQGLTKVGIWTQAGKPPGKVYIDDRGLRHTSWEDTLTQLSDPTFLHRDLF